MYDKNGYVSILKLGIKYKIYKNAVLFVIMELSRGCSHLISPYGVLYGCVAVLSVDAFWSPCCINVNI
jgi:hypothetical protein